MRLAKFQRLVSAVSVSFLFSISSYTETAVEPLSVSGNQVLIGGQQGSLAGPSLFWSNNNWGGEKFYNAGAVASVKQDWNATLIRAAMGVDEGGGYLEDRTGNLNKVRTVVEAAVANDMYVIIDWHSHHAENFTAQAVEFFQQMATEYGHHNNVIYEIYNEPLQVSWSGTIKPYAEQVIGAIRAIDPDNLIIVGTPTWSQDVDAAANDPITNFSNIAYTLHFYAGTHKQFLRDKAQFALDHGIALFATEWGTVNANGDGGVDFNETNVWMDFLSRNNISHANWALNDKSEGASALTPGANTTGNWPDSQYTTSGSFVRDIVRAWGS
ncbi:MAG TPA: endoglucanase, partial [Rhodospirillaceae bacterium]|nr:endoglucanase [Rhodospirillaceae bacterium]